MYLKSKSSMIFNHEGMLDCHSYLFKLLDLFIDPNIHVYLSRHRARSGQALNQICYIVDTRDLDYDARSRLLGCVSQQTNSNLQCYFLNFLINSAMQLEEMPPSLRV